jgi:hypothetical protein
VSDERLDEQHVDAACAWLNVENGVLHRVAEDEFDLDDTALAVDLHERARTFLVDGLGEDGEAIYRRFSGGDLPEDASEADVAQRMRETFGKPSFELGCYLAASKWSLEGILREAGAGSETFETIRKDTSARLRGVIGEQKANRAQELTEEFLEALRS